MSESCGVSYDVLAWTEEWYVREETLRDANTGACQLPSRPAVVAGVRRRHHVLLRRAAVPGPRQVGHRRHMNIFGGPVLSTYTHVSDQWSTYGTRDHGPHLAGSPLRAR